jgi:hypothetical protein
VCTTLLGGCVLGLVLCLGCGLGFVWLWLWALFLMLLVVGCGCVGKFSMLVVTGCGRSRASFRVDIFYALRDYCLEMAQTSSPVALTSNLHKRHHGLSPILSEVFYMKNL